MATRYEQLRGTIAVLASRPEAQIAFLDRLLSPLTAGGSAAHYGNVELIEQFGDIFAAHRHMTECGELRPSEHGAIEQLDQLVSAICAEQDDVLWEREALFSDARWEDLRTCASEVLTHLPDEQRHSDYTRNL